MKNSIKIKSNNLSSKNKINSIKVLIKLMILIIGKFSRKNLEKNWRLPFKIKKIFALSLKMKDRD